MSERTVVTIYDDETEFTDLSPRRAPNLDDIAAAQDGPTVMECQDGFDPIFRNREVCGEECIRMGCQYGKE